MDHWQFPVGTKVWKEFSRDGVLLETRLIERYGTGPRGLLDGRLRLEGRRQRGGLRGGRGPGRQRLDPRRAGRQGVRRLPPRGQGPGARPFGPAAGQPRAADRPGLTLGRLVERALLSAPPPAGASYAVPGDATTAAALGYLHANCGHCHNENGTSWPDTQMVLRLRVSERTAADSELVQSVVGGKLQS